MFLFFLLLFKIDSRINIPNDAFDGPCVIEIGISVGACVESVVGSLVASVCCDIKSNKKNAKKKRKKKYLKKLHQLVDVMHQV